MAPPVAVPMMFMIDVEPPWPLPARNRRGSWLTPMTTPARMGFHMRLGSLPRRCWSTALGHTASRPTVAPTISNPRGPAMLRYAVPTCASSVVVSPGLAAVSPLKRRGSTREYATPPTTQPAVTRRPFWAPANNWAGTIVGPAPDSPMPTPSSKQPPTARLKPTEVLDIARDLENFPGATASMMACATMLVPTAETKSFMTIIDRNAIWSMMAAGATMPVLKNA
mmetsp:Transcript_34061/g.105197  ORF Transcript_34061/g.105197 Transcript_34061/m.105197 type:complete len:224 (+) Transcript_34061:399-1070(+)